MLACGDVMRPISVRLYADEPVASAIDFMMDRHMGLVPVVDRGEHFVGMVGGERLMHFLLPRHLTMIRGLDRMSYLRESREELVERLDELGRRPIAEVMDPRARLVHPDTPLIEALKVLAGTQFVVPVVAREDRRLLGAISFFTVLARLRADGPAEEG